MSTQVIPVRELNQHTSAVLKRVQSGEELLVSISGKVVARLTQRRLLVKTKNLCMRLIRRCSQETSNTEDDVSFSGGRCNFLFLLFYFLLVVT